MKHLALLLDQKFEEVGETSLDTRKRVTIAKAIDHLRETLGPGVESKFSFSVSCNSVGQILLSPETTIPLHEAWLYKNPEALASVRRGLEQAAKGQLEKMESLEEFADDEIE